MPDLDAAGRPLKSFKGLMEFLGAKLTAWGPNYAVIEIQVADCHRNGINVVHGGVMAALIDTAGAHAGIFCSEPTGPRKAMTISLNVNLVDNIPEGTLIAEARVRKAGKTIFVSSCDVHDGNGNLLATGEVVGRYGPESGTTKSKTTPPTN